MLAHVLLERSDATEPADHDSRYLCPGPGSPCTRPEHAVAPLAVARPRRG
ncbi:uridine kinase, partial [Xanthomonas oryzae pv. oryzae]